jgi:hypothetical protein
VQNHRTPRVILALLVASAIGTGARAQDDKLELRLRLKQGEVYRLKTTVEQRINQTVGANAQATEQTFAVGYRMAVESVDGAGNMKVATTYDTVVFRQKGPSGAVEYDSANPPKQVPPAAKAFAALAGLGFKSTVTPAGKVTAVEGLDAMFAEMVRKLELPDGPQKAAVQKVLTEQFGEESMKQNLQNVFALYPDTPVAVGESWRRHVVVARGFPTVIDGTYTLKSRENGVAHVEIKATLSPNEEAGPVELGTGKMSYELKGEQSGVADVDEATGWTRSLTTTQTVGGSLRFQPAGGAAEVNNPITIQEKVTIEEVK